MVGERGHYSLIRLHCYSKNRICTFCSWRIRLLIRVLHRSSSYNTAVFFISTPKKTLNENILLSQLCSECVRHCNVSRYFLHPKHVLSVRWGIDIAPSMIWRGSDCTDWAIRECGGLLLVLSDIDMVRFGQILPAKTVLYDWVSNIWENSLIEHLDHVPKCSIICKRGGVKRVDFSFKTKIYFPVK